MDSRTYIRTVCDKIFKDNFVCLLLDKIIKFYCTIFSHPVKSLKFDGNIPIKTHESASNPFSQNVTTKQTL